MSEDVQPPSLVENQRSDEARTEKPDPSQSFLKNLSSRSRIALMDVFGYVGSHQSFNRYAVIIGIGLLSMVSAHGGDHSLLPDMSRGVINMVGTYVDFLRPHLGMHSRIAKVQPPFLKPHVSLVERFQNLAAGIDVRARSASTLWRSTFNRASAIVESAGNTNTPPGVIV